MRLKLSVLALAVAAALPFSSLAQKAPEVSGAVGTAPGKAAAGAVVTASAVVKAIDPATRSVTLGFANGESRTIVAGEEVRNFDKIKVGDTVNVKYAEALTIELKKGGKAALGKTETSSLDRAKPGEKPGGVATRKVTAVGEVVAVDAAKKKVSVKGASGEVVDLNVQDPEQLKLVKVGDQVEATYTQALALSLEPAKPAAAPAKPAPAPKK
jgi:Cu/Ag efflux protein CusF